MRKICIFEGEAGDKGQSGLDGVGADNGGYTSLSNPVLDLFRQNKLAKIGSLSATRNSSASILDRYGNIVYLPASTIDNNLTYSEDFSQWTDIASSWSINATGISDPLGGNNATRIQIDNDIGQLMLGLTYAVATPGTYTGSFWIRNNTGTVTEISIQRNANAEIQVIPVTVTGAWQRVSISYAEDADGTFYINARGSVGTRFDLFGAQVNSGGALTEYLVTNGSTASQAYTGNIIRQNHLGCLIEGEDQNQCAYSEDLSQAEWDISGCSISQYSSTDIFGKVNQNTLATLSSNTATFGQSATITTGNTYTLSVFIKTISASIASVIGKVGGIPQEFDIEELDFSEFTRISATVTAGSLQSFDISVTAEGAGDFVITGFQLESDYLSSYTETSESPTTRAGDLISTEFYGLPRGIDAFSIVFTINEPFNSESDRFVFSNNDVDEFSAKFSGDNLVVTNGADSLIVDGTLSKYEIVSDGATMSAYSNSVLLSSVTLTSPSLVVAPELFIGSNGTDSQISAYIDLFKIYDSALTVDQLRFLRGSDYE